MIRLVLPHTPEAAQAEELLRTHRASVFACKLHANRAAYGWDEPFSRANLLLQEGQPVGLSGSLDDQCVLLCDALPDPEELAVYLQMDKTHELMADAACCRALLPYLGGWSYEESAILKTVGARQADLSSQVEKNGELSGIFDLLAEPFELPPTSREGFERDLRLRIDRWICDLYAIYRGGRAQSTITVTRAPGLRLIGSVATARDARSQGLAGAILRTILDSYRGESIAVMALHDVVAGFYKQFGFTETGRWGRLRAPQHRAGKGKE